MDAIRIAHLEKTYREVGKKTVHSVRDLSLAVHQGEVFGFLGRNGAGKTTTIKFLCGLLKATKGEAFLFDLPVRSRASRGLFGYLPEQPYFYEYLTPKETLNFYGELQGLSRATRAQEWDRLSEMLDLRGIADQRIKGFSKGMRQRIGFAVALVGDPKLLILDEPMSGLDPMGRRNIRELILQQRDEAKTIFFSSHVLSDVEEICDRVGILVEGTLAREGRIDALLQESEHAVEISASSIPPELAGNLQERAIQHHQLDGVDLFLFADTHLANTVVREIQQAGGTLEAFRPIKESLESYFMREHPES